MTDADIDNLIAQRDEFRQRGKYTEADKIRSQLRDSGLKVEDFPTGTIWWEPRQ